LKTSAFLISKPMKLWPTRCITWRSYILLSSWYTGSNKVKKLGFVGSLWRRRMKSSTNNLRNFSDSCGWDHKDIWVKKSQISQPSYNSPSEVSLTEFYKWTTQSEFWAWYIFRSRETLERERERERERRG